MTRAVKVARRGHHPELSNIESNLATAYRRKSEFSYNRKQELKKSITHRLRALQFKASTSEVQLRNAYDSVGNDYSQLAEFGPEIDREAFRRAMVAYRSALPFRPKEIAPINWARTQFNIANNYGRACRLTTGVAAPSLWVGRDRPLRAGAIGAQPAQRPHDWAP